MILKNLKIEKIKVIKDIITEAGNPEYFEDEYHDEFDKESQDEYEIEDDGDEEDHLCYLIRTFLNGNGITSSVERSDLDILVYVFLQRKEKFRNIVKTFDVVINKMKKDILPQYELEVELYESKQGIPILSFSFFYGDKDDKAPF